MPDLTTLGMIALLAVVGYFMLIRPQQKRAKEQQALMKALEPGVRVMMSGGVYGTIRHLGEKQVVVEVSPGVELTFVKAAIVRPLKDDEEEFEYDDAPSAPVADAVPEDAAWAQPAETVDAVADDAETPADTVEAAGTDEPQPKAADQG